EAGLSGGKYRENKQGTQCDKRIGHDHSALTVPAVDIHSCKRADQGLRQKRRHGGKGKYFGRAGFKAEPDNDREVDKRTAEQGQELPCPYNKESSFPVIRKRHNYKAWEPRYGGAFQKS